MCGSDDTYAGVKFFLVLKTCFMYLRAILCTFQISVDFYYVPVGGRGGGRGGPGRKGDRMYTVWVQLVC